MHYLTMNTMGHHTTLEFGTLEETKAEEKRLQEMNSESNIFGMTSVFVIEEKAPNPKTLEELNTKLYMEMFDGPGFDGCWE